MRAGKKKNESFGSMRRRAEDRQDGEFLCRGPARRQKTNDDDE